MTTGPGNPATTSDPRATAAAANARREAIAAMRRLAVRNLLDGLRVKDLIAEGRR